MATRSSRADSPRRRREGFLQRGQRVDDQRFLVGPAPVDRGLADAGARRDRLDRDARHAAFLGQQVERGVDDRPVRALTARPPGRPRRELVTRLGHRRSPSHTSAGSRSLDRRHRSVRLLLARHPPQYDERAQQGHRRRDGRRDVHGVHERRWRRVQQGAPGRAEPFGHAGGGADRLPRRVAQPAPAARSGAAACPNGRARTTSEPSTATPSATATWRAMLLIAEPEPACSRGSTDMTAVVAGGMTMRHPGALDEEGDLQQPDRAVHGGGQRGSSAARPRPSIRPVAVTALGAEPPDERRRCAARDEQLPGGERQRQHARPASGE